MTQDQFEREIANLGGLPRPRLLDRWRKLYRREPPKGASKQLLRLAVAYRMQLRRHGGLKASTKRRLYEFAGTTDTPATRALKSSVLGPGTRLVREWNGSLYEVEVVETGFRWKGEVHSSLSSVARAITGSRWSGPRFFGLGKEAKS